MSGLLHRFESLFPKLLQSTSYVTLQRKMCVMGSHNKKGKKKKNTHCYRSFLSRTFVKTSTFSDQLRVSRGVSIVG